MRRALAPNPVPARSRALRRLLPVAVLGAALALSACQTQSPVSTEISYNAADGVPVDLGPVQVRNLLVVTDGKGKPGVLSGSLSNTSSEALKVQFRLPQGDPVTTTAPAHSQAQLSESEQLQLPEVPVAPGDVVTLSVQSGTAPETVVVVPVLKASGYYASLAPTAASS